MARSHIPSGYGALTLAACVASYVAGCDGAGQASNADAATTRDAGSDAGSSAADGGTQTRVDASVPHEGCDHYTAERQPFFGDLHVHTALSLDANVQGTRVRPADSYRFARGETLPLPPYDADGKATRTTKLSRPLDFTAVTDHAEFLGLVKACTTPGADVYDDATCAGYRSVPNIAFFTLNAALAAEPGSATYVSPCTDSNDYCGASARSVWQETIDAAEAAYDRSTECSFTTFVGYEWSASPGTKNLHRNVIFANAAVPTLPFSYFDGNREDELWDALSRDCIDAGGGCDALTIPHNSNLSAGLMFENVQRTGAAIDADYAKRRRTFEPLAEMTQHKGSSECMPVMGSDEECNFELLPYNTLSAVALSTGPQTLEPRDFLRQALGEGLALEASLGESPFAFGFIGSTDTHVGAAGGVEESTFVGHGGAGKAASSVGNGLVDQVFVNPGGLAVLWAEENTRESLFSAMRRREAYATSGPRDSLRFFVGYDLPDDMCDAGNFAGAGYQGGVPMGGDLSARESSPKMAVSVLADADGDATSTGLDRIQIVKGTLDDAGKPVFEVFDLDVAPGEPSADPESCKGNRAGAASLCAVFTDPGYDATVPAFYYARVLHAPSCRWQRIACLDAGVSCDGQTPPAGFEGCCASQPSMLKERAWSSPVFLHPSAR